MRRNWHMIEHSLPDEGIEVEVISPGGIETTLKRNGRLWFDPDGSMYMYWTPMFWREIE